MAPKQRSVQALLPLFTDSTSICFSCQRSIALQNQSSRVRTYASAAAAAVAQARPDSAPTSSALSTTTDAHPVARPSYAVHAGILLSRPPFLTRTLHPFEKAFFLYQRRLNERLAIPFTRYFYFKKGTPADREWKRKMRTRLTPARDIGSYSGYGDAAWNDEVLVGDDVAEPNLQRERLVQDMLGESVAKEGLGAAPELEDGEPRSETVMAAERMEAEHAEMQRRRTNIEMPASRRSRADERGDEKSLDRQGDRTLYLLVKADEGRWIFPSSKILEKESLHRAAERIVVQAGGPNMNTWVVGNVPVGHYAYTATRPTDDEETGTKLLGRKTFFIKARMMSGQANITDNRLGITDFKWLAKDEIQKTVTSRYWAQVEDMLVER